MTAKYDQSIKTRDSNYELLRIIAMFCIILYHLLLYFIDDLSNNDPFYKAIQIPLHIGVILFVLISGYYGIKPSLRGGLLLLLPVIIYYTSLEFVFNIIQGENVKAIKALVFFSYSPYWYIRTYFYLYLISPIINSFIENRTQKEINIMTIILIGVSCYMGLNKGDISLEGGKNIFYFIALYLLGNRIKNWDNNSSIFSRKSLVFFLALNTVIILLYIFLDSNIIRAILIKSCYIYCSPILLLSATLLFCYFRSLRFRNEFVNRIAKSTYSMYIIHNQPVILNMLISPICVYLYGMGNTVILMLSLIFLTLLIMVLSFILDTLLKPIYLYIATKITYHVTLIFNKYIFK